MNRLFRKIGALAMAVILLAVTFLSVIPTSSVAASQQQQAPTAAFKVKHLLAREVERLRQAEAGEVTLAAYDYLETEVYYDTLPEDEKRLYQAFAKLYARMDPYESSNEYYNTSKNGTLNGDIKSGKVVVAKLTRKYTSEEENEMFNDAWKAFYLDHPYNLASYIYTVYRMSETNNRYFALCRYSRAEDFDFKQWTDSLVQFEDAALETIMTDSLYSETRAAVREYLVHEYICERVSYDYSKPAGWTVQFAKIKSPYGPMVENKGVCIGIAYMAKILLDDLGVQTYIVSSGRHAWNMVCLDNEYYELDCTWDLDSGKGVKYKYFNRTTTELTELDTSGAHVRNGCSLRIPTAAGKKYTYEAVCELLGQPEEEKNPDEEPNPTYANDDYVDDDTYGELFPNMEDYEYGGLIYDLNSDGYAICKGAVRNREKVRIHDFVTLTDEEGYEYEYPVCVIAPEAFAYNKKLNKVTVGGNVMFIAEDAFRKCKNLKTIWIIGADYLEEVEDGAFSGICKKAVFRILDDADYFKYVKQIIRMSGVPAKVKFIREWV